MKVDQLIDLNEGLKFGNKEIQSLNKEARNINIGIEYEFFLHLEPDELLEVELDDGDYRDILEDLRSIAEFRGNAPDVIGKEVVINGRSELYDEIHDYLADLKDEAIPTFINRLVDAYAILPVDTIGEAFNFNNMFNTARDIAGLIGDLDEVMDGDIDEFLETRLSYTGGHYIGSNLKNIIDRLDDFINKIKTIPSNIHNLVAEKIQAMDGDGAAFHTPSAQEYIERKTENMIDDFGVPMSLVQYVTTEFEPEQPMSEVVFEVLPIDEALDFMKLMFAFIDEHGYTTNASGMHVNMSLRNVKFTYDNFNVIKLIVLLDLAHTTGRQATGRTEFAPGLFPPRASVHDIFDLLVHDRNLPKFLLQCALYGDTFEDLEAILLEWVDTDAKHQTISFRQIKTEVSDLKRIEFRYFGGENYEEKFDLLRFQIYRAAYYLKAAFDPEFGEKEYKSLFIRWMNRFAQSVWGIDFGKLKRIIDGVSKEEKQEISYYAKKTHNTLPQEVMDIIEKNL